MQNNPLFDEIMGQPEACLATTRDPGVNGMLEALAAEIERDGRLLITGMGASCHIGEILASTLRHAGYQAWSVPTSELLHYGLSSVQSPLLILSQSGASAEIVNLLEQTRPHMPTRGLCLDAGSPLAEAGACVLPGGLEKPFAATRSFSTTLTALLGLAQRLHAVDRAPLDAIEAMRPILAGGLELVRPVSRHLGACHTLVTSGRGPLVGLANAAALLVMEVCRLPVLGLEAAQLRHGPIEMLGEGTGIILLNAAGDTSSLIERLRHDVAKTGSPIAVFDASGDAQAQDNDRVRRISSSIALPEALAALPLIAMTQLLAYDLAKARDIEPGTPLRSNKVTREE